jgi:hypothetical protein
LEDDETRVGKERVMSKGDEKSEQRKGEVRVEEALL